MDEQTVSLWEKIGAGIAVLLGTYKGLQVKAAKRKDAPAGLQDVADEVRRIRNDVDVLTGVQFPAMQRRMLRLENMHEEDRQLVMGTLEQMQDHIESLGRKFTALKQLIAGGPPPSS